jgi:modulator of FtsH protease HflK
MERNIQRNGLINFLALLAVGMAGFIVAAYAHSPAGQITTIFLTLGALVAAVGWFQMRLEERERLEKLEFDELAKSKGGSALFQSREADIFPAQRSREQFERFFVPAFTIFLLLLEVAGVIFPWRGLALNPLLAVPQRSVVAMALFALFFLILFLIGRFSATMARLENHRLLRPSASFLLLNAYGCLAVAAGLGLVYSGYPRADIYVARGLCLVLGLIAAETLINLLLEIYRPRLKGRVTRPVYESRLVGLLGQPEDLFTTAAQALDYQFGFKVSETWAFQMLWEKLPLFIAGLAAAAILSSCFVFLEPGEQALVEHFGHAAAAGDILGPGAHLKLPWPIDRTYRFEAGMVHSFNVGFIPDPERENDPTILWTQPHYKEEYNLLVANREQSALAATNQSGGSEAVPVNLLVAGIPIQYRITNVLAWAYGQAEPESLLQQAATREIVRYFAGVDFFDIMAANRASAAAELRTRIQSRADELNLGVEVFFVGLQDIHPPVKVASSFEDVNGAAEEVNSKILKAEGDTNRTVVLAQATARAEVLVAEGAAQQRVSSARADAARFTNQIAAYQAAPEVYPGRVYLQTVARAAADARKYVIGPTNVHGVFQINLEDKIAPDILESLSVQTNR